MLWWEALGLCVDWVEFVWPALGLEKSSAAAAAASAARVSPDAARAAGRADAMPPAGAESERGAAVGVGSFASPSATEPALTAATTAALAAACSAATAITRLFVVAAAAGGSAEGVAGTSAATWREPSPRRPLVASVEAERRAGLGE